VPDDVTVRPTEREALTNVNTVLQVCGAGKIRCSEKTARPPATSVTTIAKGLQYGDFYPDEPIAAFAWPLLVQAGGLARLAGSRLELIPKGHNALSDPPVNVVRQIWARWPQYAPIDEFSRVDQIKGQRGTNVLTAARGRGHRTRSLPADEWINIDKLFLLMSKAGPNFSIARIERALWRLYRVDPVYEGYGDWPIVEGRYALAVLFEYAAAAHARDDYRDNWGGDDLDSLSRYDGLLAVG
jgi:hypothetical protein